VYSIAHNVALTWKAKERRWQHRRLALDESPQVIEDPVDERRIQLETLISRLPPVDRQLVILWLEGFTTTQIAEAAGMRPGTVGVLLTRIRQSLAEAFRSSEANNG
jgi:RNA polymerase sigma-70 factor (ECF subfamily)